MNRSQTVKDLQDRGKEFGFQFLSALGSHWNTVLRVMT